MAEVKLGSKHECPSCKAKFYDLGRPNPACPSCGAELAGAGDENTESVEATPSPDEEEVVPSLEEEE